ncbi:hypothetical protein [Sphingobium sp. WCS2017Hpa-17]|uniref:hypothetical protein n=1 Tax=Sphingobium sp. WCS2017Hpa-17 TaxID=3073638 RepID=UPI00288C0BA2|nr:hypothetical protein [Sphingobium sp. WCS2017Hpa-17]
MTTDTPSHDLRSALEPFKHFDGPLPDYDSPMRCVYESGIQYAVNLLAKTLEVDDWEPCDGTEEFDGDLGGTLFNIVLAAMPKNADGDPMHPEEVRRALASDTIGNGGGDRLHYSGDVMEAVQRLIERGRATLDKDGYLVAFARREVHADDCDAMQRPRADCTCAPTIAHSPAAEPVVLREALDQCMKQFAFYATEHAKAGKAEKAATNQRFADLCHTALATPARTDDAAQAGGSVTQSDADAANAWMRDHLDGGNAPGSLCIAFAQHRERHAQAGGDVAAMREALAELDWLGELAKKSVDTAGACDGIDAAIEQIRGAISTQAAYPTGAGEGERLRIGWWNDMKARGVSDEAAILKIQAALTPADARKGDG